MRSLVIGLDGASFNVLEPWVAEGRLPVLARMIEQGASGVLRSTIPPLTCPAVPCLCTGKNPGKLGVGVHGFVKSDGGLVGTNDIDSCTLWDILNSCGCRSCIANLPCTYPPQPLDGVLISGAPPSPDCKYVYPPHLQEQLTGFHVSNKIFMELKEQIFDRRRSGLDQLKDLMWRRYYVFKDIAKQENPEFGLLWVQSTDVIQHWSWNNPQFVLEIFQEVDKILEDIATSFADVNLLVVSDHGFEGPYYREFNVNAWLMDQGFLRFEGSSWLNQFLRRWYLVFKKQLPPKVHSALRSLRGRVQQAGGAQVSSNLGLPVMPGADWRDGGAYLFCDWGIRVVPGEMTPRELDRFIQDIVDKLSDLEDGIGRKVVKDVWRREEVFGGPHVGEFPDIVFLLNRYEPREDLTGEAMPETLLNPRFGRHDFAPEGIIVACGPDMRKGIKLEGASILDVAPTILHLMGTAVPSTMDGRVLQEIFVKESEPGTRPVVYSDDDYAGGGAPAAELSVEEEQLTIERLKALGYLE